MRKRREKKVFEIPFHAKFLEILMLIEGLKDSEEEASLSLANIGYTLLEK